MQSDEYATVAGLDEVAPAFVAMANRMVYCILATVDRRGRPRSRIVHTLWTWDGSSLVGWGGSIVTPIKRAHLQRTPYASCSYWDGVEAYDTCTAECHAELLLDEASRREGWELFRAEPPPLGYDPALIPQWKDGPTSAPTAQDNLHLGPHAKAPESRLSQSRSTGLCPSAAVRADRSVTRPWSTGSRGSATANSAARVVCHVLCLI